MVVAEYTGRPPLAKDYYENVRKLLLYYQAQTLYENNLKGLKIYFEQKKSLHLLKTQPSIIRDIVKDSRTNRGYGIHMNGPIKDQAEIYLRDWLLEKRSDTEGEDKLNLHSLYSIPLIQELIRYDSKKGNFDRAIAMMLVILHMQDNHKIVVKEKLTYTSGDGIFGDKRLFRKQTRNNTFVR